MTVGNTQTLNHKPFQQSGCPCDAQEGAGGGGWSVWPSQTELGEREGENGRAFTGILFFP